MARKKKADMEVLPEVTDMAAINETEESNSLPFTPLEPSNEIPDEPDPDPIPPVIPETPIYIILPFRVMDAFLAEIKSGKTVAEAVKVDSNLEKEYTAHPFLIVRETRNGFYYALRDDLAPKASPNLGSFNITPVSYAVPK